jgi:hypothetical protein
MQDFYDGVDPLAPLVDAVDHIWPGDPGYDDSESEEDDEDGTEENAKKDAEEEDAEEDGEAGDEDPFASSPAETPSKGMGSMSLASAKPKAKVKGRKGCKDNKPNNRMDSEDSDDEAPNTPTKRNRVGRLIPAPHRSGRTQRKSTPRANSNQPSTNKAVGSKLVSILTPTKRKVSGSLNEPISQKTVRFASPLDDSAAGTQVAIGSSKAAIETPSKRTRKKPEFDVKRGSRTGLDAPAYNIKLPNITITTLEILT